MPPTRLFWNIPPRLLRLPWPYWRRGVQIVLLILFLVLFRQTEQTGSEPVGTQVNIFFRLDPLAALSAIFAGREFILAFWPALLIMLLTIVLGRFFCGWICPLGTLLDGFHWLIRLFSKRWPRESGATWPELRTLKFILLSLVLFGALLNLPLIGFTDPLALLYRGLSFTVDPTLTRTVDTLLGGGSEGDPGSRGAVGQALFNFLHGHQILALRQATFQLAKLSGLILLVIFLLELVARRFWCRYLCPLGGLVGLLSFFPLLRREPVKKCPNCAGPQNCRTTCRMGAFDVQGQFSPQACNLCMDCVEDCPKDMAAFTLRLDSFKPTRFELSRRAFLGSVGIGVAAPAIFRLVQPKTPARTSEFLIRPPGAQIEDRFLGRCVRCGLCLKVCPTNVLQPTLLESGFTGVFTPRLDMRIGFCSYDCLLCGQVCPSGAIPRLATPGDKHQIVIGEAEFNPQRCMSYAEGIECGVCEQNCPVPNKAILLRATDAKNPQGEIVTIQRPYVKKSRCIGCGTCENVCPMAQDGEAGIRVRRKA